MNSVVCEALVVPLCYDLSAELYFWCAGHEEFSALDELLRQWTGQHLAVGSSGLYGALVEGLKDPLLYSLYNRLDLDWRN